VKIATVIKVAIFLLVLVVGVSLWYKYLKPEDPPLKPPAAGTVIPQETKPVHHGDPVLPQPDAHTTGVVHITIPPDTSHQVDPTKPTEIDVYIPDNPDQPPEVRSDTPLQATFTPVTDRWVVLGPRFLLGGSASIDGYVSPWAGLSIAKFWHVVNVGPGIDRSAIGVFLSYEFYREFNAGAMWYALPLRDGASRAGIVVSYRF
jgi:hypothetical protein